MVVLAVLAFLYLSLGYYCFWRCLEEVKPGRASTVVMPLLALVFGSPIFVYAIVRVLINPRYRPVHVVFYEIEYDPQTGGLTHEGTYETVWRTPLEIHYEGAK